MDLRHEPAELSILASFELNLAGFLAGETKVTSTFTKTEVKVCQHYHTSMTFVQFINESCMYFEGENFYLYGIVCTSQHCSCRLITETFVHFSTLVPILESSAK